MMSAKYLLPLTLLRLSTITQLEETCISNCRLTWTRAMQIQVANCNCGDGTTEFGYPGCVNYSDNQNS